MTRAVVIVVIVLLLALAQPLENMLRADAPPAGPFTRRVVLPMAPIDLAERLDGDEATGSDDERSEDEDCLRVRGCIDAAALALEPLLANIVNDPSIQDQCLADTGIPPSVLLESCQ